MVNVNRNSDCLYFTVVVGIAQSLEGTEMTVGGDVPFRRAV